MVVRSRCDGMRVTLLSKALVVGAYQRKAELLAEHPGLHLTVLVPTHWGRQQLERAHTCGYALSPIPICLSGHFHTHFYPSLTAALRRSQPDVLHVDEEPVQPRHLACRAASRAPATEAQNRMLLLAEPQPTLSTAVQLDGAGRAAPN